MRVIVVEDEKLAAERLVDLIKQCDSTIEVVATLDSVKRTVEWLNGNDHPDLAFFDIQLSDGLSFEVFEKIIVDCPVIFTTAFNEYAIRAFKVNSVDYLLKPIDNDELNAAIDKFRKNYSGKEVAHQQEVMDKVLHLLTNNYKQRFAIKVGEHIRSISIENILYFYSLEKATFLHTDENRNYVIDYPLEQLEELVDPSRFFKINRKYMITIDSVDDIITYSNSRLKIELKHSSDQDVIVAREKVKSFKKWLDR